MKKNRRKKSVKYLTNTLLFVGVLCLLGRLWSQKQSLMESTQKYFHQSHQAHITDVSQSKKWNIRLPQFLLWTINWILFISTYNIYFSLILGTRELTVTDSSGTKIRKCTGIKASLSKKYLKCICYCCCLHNNAML